ncbi:MAG: uL15 family ribosomal protein [Candidatus Geothermarchaeales archaeon]
MPHRERKTRKKRGSRTVGWGRVGQHRGSGMRGGFGKAGMHKHKWIYTLKYEPDHYGKHGFKSIRKPPRTINVGKLEEIIRSRDYEKGARGMVSIDLSRLGFNKLLGGGKVSTPMEVRVEKASEKAKEKIESLGGKVTTP